MKRFPSPVRAAAAARRQLARWNQVPRLLRSLWRTSPTLFVTVAILRLLRALQTPAMLFVGKLIIDEIVLQTRTPSPGPALNDWIDSGRASALAGWIFVEFLLVAGGNALNRLGMLVEGLLAERHGFALDARSEAEVFERFRHLGAGKTALLISHRFSTVRMADRILVLENGAILESGSHAQLMALGGRYAELFNLQAAGFL